MTENNDYVFVANPKPGPKDYDLRKKSITRKIAIEKGIDLVSVS